MTTSSDAPNPNTAIAPQSFWDGFGTQYAYVRSSSVRRLGRAVEALLGLYLLASLALIFPLLHELDLLHRLQGDPRSVGIDEAQRADDRVHFMSLLLLGLYLAVIVVWLVWFHRARTNVDAWQSRNQRHGSGWAIGGWFCPIVNYWFPYQIARDIMDDTDGDLGRSHDRPHRPLLLCWWLAFVTKGLFDLAERRSSDRTIDDLISAEHLDLVGIGVTVLAGVLAIAVVRQLTAAQTARRERAHTIALARQA